MNAKAGATVSWFSLLLILLISGTALAKGGVHEITVTGGGLDGPVEITDPRIVDEFNPWGGLHQFLSERLDEDAVDPRALEGPYTVRFLSGVHEWVYRFSYYATHDGEAGYIVLPEPPESQGFVHPAGWYRSTDAWTEVMSERLERLVTPSEPWRVGSGWLPQILVVLSTMAVLGLDAVQRLLRDRMRRHPRWMRIVCRCARCSVGRNVVRSGSGSRGLSNFFPGGRNQLTSQAIRRATSDRRARSDRSPPPGRR